MPTLCEQVRWAACQALGQMCTDLGPELQEQHHAQLLPALMALMDDFNNPRVQVREGAGERGRIRVGGRREGQGRGRGRGRGRGGEGMGMRSNTMLSCCLI